MAYNTFLFIFIRLIKHGVFRTAETIAEKLNEEIWLLSISWHLLDLVKTTTAFTGWCQFHFGMVYFCFHIVVTGTNTWTKPQIHEMADQRWLRKTVNTMYLTSSLMEIYHKVCHCQFLTWHLMSGSFVFILLAFVIRKEELNFHLKYNYQISIII